MGHKNEDVQLTIYQHQQICLAVILQVSALALCYSKICLCFCIVHHHKDDQEQLFCGIVIVKSLVAGYIDFSTFLLWIWLAVYLFVNFNFKRWNRYTSIPIPALKILAVKI